MGKCNPAHCNRDVAGWWATYQRKRQKATAATHLAGILDRRSQLGLANCLACAWGRTYEFTHRTCLFKNAQILGNLQNNPNKSQRIPPKIKKSPPTPGEAPR